MRYNIITDDIDGESSWYYYPEGPDRYWNIIKNDWLGTCKHKYFDYVLEKDVMITCGAHVGMYTKFYAKQFNTVYAFEPDPFHFFCLCNNVKETNVIKIQAAVGYDRKLIDLYQNGPNGHLCYAIDEKKEGKIPVLRIDDLNLPVCSLIQMDVENYEYQALLGAEETIKRCSPVIIAENGHVENIVNFLESLGYKIVDKTSYDTIWSKNET